MELLVNVEVIGWGVGDMWGDRLSLRGALQILIQPYPALREIVCLFDVNVKCEASLGLKTSFFVVILNHVVVIGAIV